jgi:hypothetical protein
MGLVLTSRALASRVREEASVGRTSGRTAEGEAMMSWKELSYIEGRSGGLGATRWQSTSCCERAPGCRSLDES